MIPRSRWRPLPFVAALLLCVLSPFVARSQDEQEEEARGPEVPPDGMEYFRHKLFEAGMQPLRRTSDIFSEPHRTVIVIVGDQSVQRILNQHADDIRLAMEFGAAVLIATDRPTAGTQVDWLNVEITGKQVNSDAEGCFRGKAFHPFVRPFRAVRGLEEDSPRRMFHERGLVGDEALATNHPSTLRIIPKRFPAPEPLAGYPFNSWFGNNEEDKLVPERDLFAAGGFYQRGRYLILADHSVFLNQMLLATTDGTDLLNSNLQFTIDCIDWLKGDSGRDRCLFVEDGDIKTDFELQFPESNDSDLERIMKLLMFLEANGNGNKLLARAQDENLFNRLLRGYISTREIIRAFVIALVCLSIFFLLWLTVRNRASTDPARLLVTPELAAMIPRGDVLHQRFDSVQDVDNIYEHARQLVRDFLGGMNADPDEHGLPPKLVIEDSYADADALRRKLGRLWRIAYDSEPVRVAPNTWDVIKNDLKDVLADADDGWWHFVKRSKSRG